MKAVFSDFVYGARLLARSPGFALVAVLTLALGIGASTAIFSAVNAVLLRPLPFRNAERIVTLWESDLQQGRARDPVSPPNFLDWRKQSQSFEEMAAYLSWRPNFKGALGAERLQGAKVTANLFRLLGVSPIIGRYFAPGDDLSTGGSVVLISYGLWRRQFAADSKITSRTITLNGEKYLIIGVMPPKFQFPVGEYAKELWVPLVFDAGDLNGRATRYLQVVARLKPKVSLPQARVEMREIAGRLEQQYPETNSRWGVALSPFYDQLVADARPTLLILLVAVSFVLLIGCANVANLLLARGSGRHEEMAIRVAVGASRYRIIRQLLAEGAVLALAGGILGVLLAHAGIRIIVAAAPEGIPRLKEVGEDFWVLVFSALLTLLTVFLFGLFPALQVSKANVGGVLREGGKGLVAGMGKTRFRSILVVTEVALAFVLLVGAGLIIKSFSRLIGVDPGFNAHNVLTAQIDLPYYKYGNPRKQREFFDQLLERVGALPGVQAAGVISYLPLSGSNMEWIFSIKGRAPSRSNEKLFAEYRQVNADYFKAMGVPLLRGRTFSSRDSADALPVILVNDAFARQYFPNEDPIHKRIGFGLQPAWREIIGIVADVRHFGLESKARAEAYVPYQQDPWSSMALVIRSKSGPVTLISAVRRELTALDKEQPLYGVQTMESLVAESVAPRRLGMLLLGIFSGIALVLAAIGILGVMASHVSQRTHEIAIRIALGAKPASVQKLVVLQAVAMAFAGVAVGFVMSVWLTHFISNLLYDVRATDPAVLGGVAILLTGVLMLASYIPARRASIIDPITALR